MWGFGKVLVDFALRVLNEVAAAPPRAFSEGESSLGFRVQGLEDLG